MFDAHVSRICCSDLSTRILFLIRSRVPSVQNAVGEFCPHAGEGWIRSQVSRFVRVVVQVEQLRPEAVVVVELPRPAPDHAILDATRPGVNVRPAEIGRVRRATGIIVHAVLGEGSVVPVGPFRAN